jgi:hypothetical protein
MVPIFTIIRNSFVIVAIVVQGVGYIIKQALEHLKLLYLSMDFSFLSHHVQNDMFLYICIYRAQNICTLLSSKYKTTLCRHWATTGTC